MTSDLSSALEICFKRDVLNKSMFTLLYFTFTLVELGAWNRQTDRQTDERIAALLKGQSIVNVRNIAWLLRSMVYNSNALLFCCYIAVIINCSRGSYCILPANNSGQYKGAFI